MCCLLHVLTKCSLPLLAAFQKLSPNKINIFEIHATKRRVYSTISIRTQNLAFFVTTKPSLPGTFRSYLSPNCSCPRITLFLQHIVLQNNTVTTYLPLFPKLSTMSTSPVPPAFPLDLSPTRPGSSCRWCFEKCIWTFSFTRLPYSSVSPY